MRRVVVNEWISLDGVAQAPGAADEDTTDGFRHGGWHLPYMDELAQKWVLDYLAEAGGFLLGRRTYQILAGYWPHAPEDQQVVAGPLNSKPKFVASSTLSEPLEWENSSLLEGEVIGAVTSLKQSAGDDLHVLGSTRLVRTLVQHDLVDELRLMIDPVVLGGGKRLFEDDGALKSLQLVESELTTTGAILARYSLPEG